MACPNCTGKPSKRTRYVSGVGCNATATNLAIRPLFAAGLVDDSRGVICELKVGSSEGGNKSSDATHHPERSHTMRSFAPTGHRHTAEVLQAIRATGSTADVHLSATAIDNVRGVLATAHLFVKPGTTEKDLWKAYRQAYRDEPFVRIVKEKTGVYRYPEPKILSGSNYADVGFEFDESHQPGGRPVRHRQPHEGRGRLRPAMHQPDARLGRDDRVGVCGVASDLTNGEWQMARQRPGTSGVSGPDGNFASFERECRGRLPVTSLILRKKELNP